MASKRTPIPGVDALFGPATRAPAEDARLHERGQAVDTASVQTRMHEDTNASMPEGGQARVQEDPHSGMPAIANAGKSDTEVVPREKFTFRFDAATLEMLERVWAELRGRTGRKLRKSWIVEAAVKHVIRDPEQALQVLMEEMKRIAIV